MEFNIYVPKWITNKGVFTGEPVALAKDVISLLRLLKQQIW